MKVFSILFFLVLSVQLIAQFEIYGNISDDQSALIGATVVIINESDSTMVSFGITNDDGNFEIYDVPNGNYLAQLSYTGYQNLFVPFETKDNKKIDLGNIKMRISSEVLKEVKISAERIPMGILGDTINYNASAFKMKEGASVEDLLKKLPGIDVQRDGSIKAYGEDVDKVLVDGKEFFNGDATMATKNLEAEAVDKVQVFDKKSDDAEFTGVDDGEEEKTINIALKEDHKTGGFGRVSVEGGTESRYKGKLNYNRFSPSTQTSVIANSNNINEQVFSFHDYIDFMGGLSNILSGGGMNTDGLFNMSQQQKQGIDLANAVGLNFNFFRSKNLNWSSNYMFINNKNDLIANSFSDNFGLSVPYTTRDTTNSISQLNNHRLNTKLEYSINPKNKLIVHANGGFRLNRSDRTSHSMYSQSNMLLNEISNNLNTKGLQYNGQLKLNYIKNYAKKGRNLKLKGSYTRATASEDNSLINQFINPNTNYSLVQDQLYKNEENTSDISLKMMEPIAKQTYLSASLSMFLNRQNPNRDFYDIEDEMSTLNTLYSGEFKRDWNQNTAGIDFQRNRKKFKIFAGLDFANTNLLAGQISDDDFVSSNKNYLLGNLKLIKNFKGSRKLEWEYFGNIQAPSLNQLITIPNNLNPNVLNVGNKNLVPEYLHNVRLNFSDINQFSFSNLFANIQFQYSENKIVYERDIQNDFTSIVKPFQSPTFYSINGYINHSSPIRKLKIKYDISTNLNFQRYQTRLNQLDNIISSSSMRNTLRIENRNKERWDLAVGINSTLSYYDNSIDNNLNQIFLTNSYYFDGLYSFKDSWEAGINYDLRRIVGQTFGEPQGESLNLHLINLEVKKNLLKNKLSISLRMHDLLNQNQGIFRNGDANSLNFSSYNTLGRYATIGFSYKIGNKKNDSFSFE